MKAEFHLSSFCLWKNGGMVSARFRVGEIIARQECCKLMLRERASVFLLPRFSNGYREMANNPMRNLSRSSARQVFIVKLWRSARKSAWLGQVQHIPSGQIVHVRSAKELLAYLRRQIEADAPGASRGLK